jgi:hypothetical protein
MCIRSISVPVQARAFPSPRHRQPPAPFPVRHLRAYTRARVVSRGGRWCAFCNRTRKKSLINPPPRRSPLPQRLWGRVGWRKEGTVGRGVSLAGTDEFLSGRIPIAFPSRHHVEKFLGHSKYGHVETIARHVTRRASVCARGLLFPRLRHYPRVKRSCRSGVKREKGKGDNSRANRDISNPRAANGALSAA